MKLFTKKLLFAFSLSLTLFNINAQITWNGAGATNNFSDAANWLGGVVPGSADNVIFDGTSSKNCDFDFDIDVASLSLNAGYGGIVNAMSTNPIIEGAFSIAAGTFISTDQVLTIGGNMSFSGGTFTHNNGVVEVAIAFGTTLVMSGAWTFYDLSIIDATPLSAPLITMDFGASATVSNILLLNGGSKPFAYKGTINVSNTLQIQGSNTSIPAGNTGTFNFNGASAIITGATAAARNKIANITINTAGAVAISGHVSLVGSWTNTNIGSFTTGTSNVYFYGASGNINSGSTATTRAYFDNVTVQTGATLNVTSGSHIDLNGNFTHIGTYTGNTSLLRFSNNSAGAQAVNGSAALTTINAIEKTGNGSLSFSHAVNLLDSIKISSGSVTGTNLTLKSTAALKARVAEISGGGSLGGTIAVETFIPGGTTDWAVLGASGVSGLDFNDWYGTIPMCIEGSATGVTSAGGQYFESVWRWDETAPVTASTGWDSLVVVTDPINVGQGYWLFVGTGLATTSPITTTVTGAAVTGSQPLTITRSGLLGADDGFNLVANPFASPISWDRIFADPTNTDVNGTIYVYNADLGVPTSYNAATQTSSHGTGIKSGIAMGQGFYVESNQAAGTLNINENHKVAENTGANPLLKTNATSSSASARLRLKINGGGFEDESVVCFLPSATTGFDNRYDGWKLYASPGYAGYGKNPWTLRTTISTLSGNDDYSINSLPLPLTANAVIPVLAKVYASGQHTISAYDINLPSGTCVTLKDKLLNVTHNLAASPYVCILSDTATTARFELTVCANITMGVNNMPIVAENVFIKQDRNGVYVDLNFESNTKAIITANNILGQQLMTPKNVECVSGKYYLDLNAKEQIIMVSVIANDKRTTKKIFVENNN